MLRAWFNRQSRAVACELCTGVRFLTHPWVTATRRPGDPVIGSVPATRRPGDPATR